MKKILILGTLIACTNLAHAYCEAERWILLKSNIKTYGSCEQLEGLSLDETTAYYVHLGTQKVRYWKGSFGRTDILNTTYIHEIYDYCTRNHRVIYSETVSREEPDQKLFALKNPNLNPNLEASYELAPLLENEAVAALARAKEECEN